MVDIFQLAFWLHGLLGNAHRASRAKSTRSVCVSSEERLKSISRSAWLPEAIVNVPFRFEDSGPDGFLISQTYRRTTQANDDSSSVANCYPYCSDNVIAVLPRSFSLPSTQVS